MGENLSHTGRHYWRNPMRAKREGGLTLQSGDQTIANYTADAWMRRDNVKKDMFPGRVERKPKRRKAKR